MLNHELGLLEKGLVLRLEHLQFLKCIVTNFLEFPFILSVNLGLDVLPVVMGEFLLVIVGFKCLLHWDWDRIRSLIDGLLDGHFGDSWAHVLDRLPDNLWLLLEVIWLNWVNILKVLLLLGHILFESLWWWTRLHVLYGLLSVLWLEVLWWRRFDDNGLRWWSKVFFLLLNVLHWLFNILNLLLLHKLWLLLVEGGLFNEYLLLGEHWLLSNHSLWWGRVNWLHDDLLWCSALNHWHWLLHSLNWWLVRR